MIVIGITGMLGAGKGTVVEYLKEEGFKHYSVRAYLTREIKRRGMPVNRDSMTIVANDLRATHSPSYIVDELYDEAERDGQNAVIESIRAKGEVTSLRAKPDFLLIGVDADPKIRYARIKLRASETDFISFERFLEDEQREINPNDPTKQDLAGSLALADYKIMNDGTIEGLRSQTDRILEDIKKKQ